MDGTTNFVHGLPFVSVSIGTHTLLRGIFISFSLLSHRCYHVALSIKRQIVCGVVYNPILDELFTASKGGGAFLNGNAIHVSDRDSIQSAVIATNVGYDRSDEGIHFMLANYKNILQAHVRSLRSLGTLS